ILAPGRILSGVLTLPSGDSVSSMHMKLCVVASLTYDLVLGRDWLFFCRQTMPHASFHLSSGIVHPGQRESVVPSHTTGTLSPTASDVDPELSEDPLACRGPTTSSVISSSATIPMTTMTSENLLRDILLRHHVTRSRIFVFHADLPTIQHSFSVSSSSASYHNRGLC
ncbi:hypothetical protein DFH07DRAFT_827427, partial [Mycena maculata]